MPDFSQRLREPLVLTILVLAVAGWLAFLAMWANSAGQAGRLQAEVTTLTGERDAARTTLSEREQTEGAISDAKADLATVQTSLEQAKTDLSTTSSDLKARNDELDQASQSLEGQKQQAADLQKQMDEATSRTQELAARQAALQAEINSSTQQLTDVGSRLEEARRQEQTSTANLAQIADEAAKATASLADTQSQLQSSRQDFATAQGQLTDAKQQSETITAQVGELTNQLKQLQGQRDAILAEVQNYESQRQILQPQVEELTKTLADRSAQLQTVETQIAANATPVPALNTYEVKATGQGQGLRLTLNDDGSFELRGRTGNRVTGKYQMDDQKLVLSDAKGSTGTATFPMICPIERTDDGISVGKGDGCLISDLRFDRVTTAN